MKYGLHTLMWTESFTREDLHLFEKLKGLGADGIEIDLGDPDSLPVKSLKKYKSDLDMGVTFTTAIDKEHNPLSEDEQTRKKAANFLKRRIEIVSELGATTLGGVLYAPWGEFTGEMRTKDEWEYAKETLNRVLPFAEKKGVDLALEPINRYETYFMNTVEIGKRLIDELDGSNAGLLLDTYHMHIEEKSQYDAIKLAGEDLLHLHLCENDRGIPGTGQLDWEGVFKAIKEIGYDEWVVIESFVPAIEEIATNTAIWRDVAPDAETLGSEGLNFIKQGLN